jgi:tetratricopeptide (TPR) repeat protein
MMKSIATGAGLALVLVVPAFAQQPTVIDARVAASMVGQFAPPLCPMRKDSRLSNIERALKSYAEERDPTRRDRALADADRLLREAIAADPDNGATWYYLGRFHLARGDMAGLDSAWTRAEAALPDCDVDMTTYRQSAWATLTNAGIEFQNAGQEDSAKVAYLGATRAYGGLPHAFMNLGVLYANAGSNDSAATYFAAAVRSTEGDSTLIEERSALLLNLGTIYQRMGAHRDAVNTFGEYVRGNPDDDNVLRQLSVSYRALDMVDSAEAVEGKLLAALSEMNLDDLDGQDLLAVGVGLFQAEQYTRAADVFRRAVVLNPYDRDALYNLANSYLALEDGPQLLTASEQLRSMEPMNEDILRLQGQALRLIGGRDDEMIQVAETLVGLPVSVEVTRVSYTATEGRIAGALVGRGALTPGGQPIPPAPFTLLFEFLDIQGNVIGTGTVEVPALTEGQEQPLALATPVSRGVAGWRYRKQ